MARAPFQVLVLLFHRVPDGGIRYAVFRRADRGAWQGVAGGGEDGETPEEAARREASEEAGVDGRGEVLALRARAEIPVAEFAFQDSWPMDVKAIPEFSFAMSATPASVRVSAEHTAVEWLCYEDALSRLEWASNRHALSELHQLLTSSAPAP
jgi:dATP pyrophosphohydrolase